MGCAAIAAVLLCVASSSATAQLKIAPGGASGEPPAKSFTERGQLVVVGALLMKPFVDAVVVALQREYIEPWPTESYKGVAEGFRQFCEGIGPQYPDIVASSRIMRKGEFDACTANGVADIIEIKIGRDAVVVVTKRGASVFNVTPRMLYLALAAEIPKGMEFIPNPYETWRDVGKSAPNLPIHFLARRDGGLRDYFNAYFLEGGCRHLKAIDAIFAAADRVPKCVTLRADDHIDILPDALTEASEVSIDSLLDRINEEPDGALAVILRRLLVGNEDRLESLPINGVLATTESIRDESYDMTIDLRFYIKRAHMRDNEGHGVVRGLREFMHFITREKAAGPNGLFEGMGLVSLPDRDRAEMRRNARTLRGFTR